MGTSRMRALALAALLGACSCTRVNADYCEDQTTCASGRCDPALHRCVDGGASRDASADAPPRDAASDGDGPAVPDAAQDAPDARDLGPDVDAGVSSCTLFDLEEKACPDVLVDDDGAECPDAAFEQIADAVAASPVAVMGVCPGRYDGVTVTDGVDVALIGPRDFLPLAAEILPGAGTALRVEGGAVVIRWIRVQGASREDEEDPDNGHGVECTGGQVTLRSADVRFSGRHGIRASGGCRLVVEKSIVQGNRVGLEASGIVVHVTNTLFAGNVSDGAILDDAVGTFDHNTIVNNGGHGVLCPSSIFDCVNNILSGNVRPREAGRCTFFGSECMGTPRFLLNFHLAPGSPCIDEGEALTLVPDDIDDEERPWPPGGAYDVGWDEFVP